MINKIDLLLRWMIWRREEDLKEMESHRFKDKKLIALIESHIADLTKILNAK